MTREMLLKLIATSTDPIPFYQKIELTEKINNLLQVYIECQNSWR